MRVDRDGRLEDLGQWLLNTVHRSGISQDNHLPRLVETWQSRTAVLYHFTWPGQSLADVVVKLHQTPGDAVAQYDSMGQVARALQTGQEPAISTIAPIDVSLELGAVLMPYIPGKSLSELLIRNGWSATRAADQLNYLVHQCGRLLATYHGATPDIPEPVRQVANHRLKSRVELAMGREVELTGLVASSPVVRSYRDFHPGHVIITPTNKLVLIDPPIEVRYDYLYRDLALFSYSIFMNLIDPRGLARNPLRVRHREALVTQFLDGYADRTGTPFTDDDLFFLNGWEAYYLSRMLRATWQRRSYGFLAYYYAPMRQRLNALRRSMTRRLRQEYA